MNIKIIFKRFYKGLAYRFVSIQNTKIAFGNEECYGTRKKFILCLIMMENGTSGFFYKFFYIINGNVIP